MTALTPVRHLVKAKLVDLLEAQSELQGVTVLYGANPKDMDAECVFIDSVTGKIETVIFAGGTGRVTYDDEFDVKLVAWTGRNALTQQEAEERVSQLLAGVWNACTTNADLAALDGVIVALLTDFDGPHTIPTNEGASSYGVLTFHVHARYQ